MKLKKLVLIVESLALVAALMFVVMLFTNEGGGELSKGAAIYDGNCAGCHGGDGGGGLGPELAGQVEDDFPNIEDQIAFVADGQGSMPAFGDSLSEEELREVVEYTRGLGG